MFNRILTIVTMGILLAGVIHVCICTELCSGIGRTIMDVISDILRVFT